MGANWREHIYDGERLSMVFTAVHGGLANRQAVTKEIGRAAKIADVARHVGHSDPSTTAEYVRSIGSRPSATAARAAQLLDPTI